MDIWEQDYTPPHAKPSEEHPATSKLQWALATHTAMQSGCARDYELYR